MSGANQDSQDALPSDQATVEPTEPTTPATAGGSDDRRFTQAELDAIVRDRLEREQRQRAKAEEKARKDAEEKALKDRAEWQTLAEQRASQLSDIEAEKLALERINQELRRDHAIQLAASSPERDKDGNLMRAAFKDPNDAMRFLDLAEIEFDEDSRPTNIAKLLRTLAKEKPYLLAEESAGNGRVTIPASPRPSGDLTFQDKLRQEIEAQRGRR